MARRNAGAAEELRTSISSAANRLGVNPVDLATVIGIETAGTFSPSIRGGSNRDGSGRGSFVGLIQFSPDNQRRYGVHPGQSISEQMASVEAYLKDRGVKPGMKLPHLYSAVLAGQPDERFWDRADANGVSVRSMIQSDNARQHMFKAAALLDGTIDESSLRVGATGNSSGNVGSALASQTDEAFSEQPSQVPQYNLMDFMPSSDDGNQPQGPSPMEFAESIDAQAASKYSPVMARGHDNQSAINNTKFAEQRQQRALKQTQAQQQEPVLQMNQGGPVPSPTAVAGSPKSKSISDLQRELADGKITSEQFVSYAADIFKSKWDQSQQSPNNTANRFKPPTPLGDQSPGNMGSSGFVESFGPGPFGALPEGFSDNMAVGIGGFLGSVVGGPIGGAIGSTIARGATGQEITPANTVLSALPFGGFVSDLLGRGKPEAVTPTPAPVPTPTTVSPTPTPTPAVAAPAPAPVAPVDVGSALADLNAPEALSFTDMPSVAANPTAPIDSSPLGPVQSPAPAPVAPTLNPHEQITDTQGMAPPAPAPAALTPNPHEQITDTQGVSFSQGMPMAPDGSGFLAVPNAIMMDQLAQDPAPVAPTSNPHDQITDTQGMSPATPPSVTMDFSAPTAAGTMTPTMATSTPSALQAQSPNSQFTAPEMGFVPTMTGLAPLSEIATPAVITPNAPQSTTPGIPSMVANFTPSAIEGWSTAATPVAPTSTAVTELDPSSIPMPVPAPHNQQAAMTLTEQAIEEALTPEQANAATGLVTPTENSEAVPEALSQTAFEFDPTPMVNQNVALDSSMNQAIADAMGVDTISVNTETIAVPDGISAPAATPGEEDSDDADDGDDGDGGGDDGGDDGYAQGGFVSPKELPKDPVSGNKIPPNASPNNVRDDIPAMLSEGEYVIPANVVNTLGGPSFFDNIVKKANEASGFAGFKQQ